MSVEVLVAEQVVFIQTGSEAVVIQTDNAPGKVITAAIQGPAGPPGPIGTDLHYTHTQSIASTTWNVTHNLGKFPSVSIVDSAGAAWLSDVRHIDSISLTITFAAAFGGVAYLN